MKVSPVTMAENQAETDRASVGAEVPSSDVIVFRTASIGGAPQLDER